MGVWIFFVTRTSATCRGVQETMEVEKCADSEIPRQLGSRLGFLDRR